jgi:hypothetical protein
MGSKRMIPQPVRIPDIDRRFARLQLWMGTPKYRIADRLGVTVRMLNRALGLDKR